MSQVIPFIETLKIEQSSSKDSDLGIKTAKNFVIVTHISRPLFKGKTVESAAQTFTTICKAVVAKQLQDAAEKTENGISAHGC